MVKKEVDEGHVERKQEKEQRKFVQTVITKGGNQFKQMVIIEGNMLEYKYTPNQIWSFNDWLVLIIKYSLNVNKVTYVSKFYVFSDLCVSCKIYVIKIF